MHVCDGGRGGKGEHICRSFVSGPRTAACCAEYLQVSSHEAAKTCQPLSHVCHVEVLLMVTISGEYTVLLLYACSSCIGAEYIVVTLVMLCLNEQVEKEYLPLYEDPGLGLTTWSPLYSGLLTGKYLDAKDDSARLHSDAWKDMSVRPHVLE